MKQGKNNLNHDSTDSIVELDFKIQSLEKNYGDFKSILEIV